MANAEIKLVDANEVEIKSSEVPEQPQYVVRKREEFVVDGLGKVIVYTAIDAFLADKEKQPRVLYEGYAIIGAPLNGKIVQYPVDFTLDASSLNEAFSKFQHAATERFKQVMQKTREAVEREQKRIVTAPAGLKLTR